jgi:hypothetical protein
VGVGDLYEVLDENQKGNEYMSSPISAIVENKQEVFRDLADPVIAFYGVNTVAKDGHEQEYQNAYDRLIKEGYRVANWDKEVAQINKDGALHPINCRVSSLVGMSNASFGDLFATSMELAFQVYSSEIAAREIQKEASKIAEKQSSTATHR